MQPLNLVGSRISSDTRFINADQHDDIFEELKHSIQWEQRDVIVQGRTYKQPRLVAWHGSAAYTYSGMRLEPTPLTPLLERLQRKVEEATGQLFNSVLLNRYVAGRNHGIGMHSDDEEELGLEPTIAMLTFGEGRSLDFSPKRWFAARNPAAKKVSVPTPAGSLLIMAGQTQKNWLHGVEKTIGKQDRITLTFRHIKGAETLPDPKSKRSLAAALRG